MVKPALPYLDIISAAKRLVPNHPIACYQVSGEFAMIHAGAAAGVYNLKTMAFETVESMVRAGACISLYISTVEWITDRYFDAGATLILTYFTPDFLDWLDGR
jgi:porphobilinogen synthase